MQRTPRRKAQSRQHWEKHIIAWKNSGQTQQDYCRSNDLNPGTFTNWKIKIKKSKQISNNNFIEITQHKNLPINLERKIEIKLGNINLSMREEIDPVIIRNILIELRGIEAC